MLLCIVPEEPQTRVKEPLLGAWRHLTQAALSLWDWSGEGSVLRIPRPTPYPGSALLMQPCPYWTGSYGAGRI